MDGGTAVPAEDVGCETASLPLEAVDVNPGAVTGTEVGTESEPLGAVRICPIAGMD
jgi:hypothetical protein